MSIQLFLAPAAMGKTAHALTIARRAASPLGAIPRVVVAGHLQVRAARRRLAGMGGALGVRVLTFDRLYAECLAAAGEVYVELPEPVQYRLLQTIVDRGPGAGGAGGAGRVPLVHYAPLAGRPGFVDALQGLVGEFKRAVVTPEVLAAAVREMGGEARLVELAGIYAAYQKRLAAGSAVDHEVWADRAGLGWLALECLARRAPHVGQGWPLLVVDGFDRFTPVQIELLRVLAGRVDELVITLTGDVDAEPRSLAHRRFAVTRREIEAALGIQAAPLPSPDCHAAPALRHLERGLFGTGSQQHVDDAAVELLEAPDREAEARAALRWLKRRLLLDGMAAGEVALLARSITPYRSYIFQAAAEFGLPVRLVDGLPLVAVPVIAALLSLLRLMLPGKDGRPGLPWRELTEAWRSPYFAWDALPADGAAEPIGIALADADALAAAARWGSVIGGLAQWEEALGRLAGRSAGDDPDEERRTPAAVPVGPAAADLLARLRRFVQRLTPPAAAGRMADFAGWLEDLIGEDPELRPSPSGRGDGDATSLRIVEKARCGAPEIAELDVAALTVLKDVLRGLVWAEEAAGSTAAVDFPRFFGDLAAGIEAAACSAPVHPDREEILVASVAGARGLPFRAVAVLGLAEGEFPQSLRDDPFLREADRRRLRQDLGLGLSSVLESGEAQHFYEAVTRPRERLLLTRPRLAGNGAAWQASPFWEEVRRLLDVPSPGPAGSALPSPDQVASWPELMRSLAAGGGPVDLADWAAAEQPARWQALAAATRVLLDRENGSLSRFDGDLSALSEATAVRFGPAHVWSASRLEGYRTCPFMFFVGSVLGLEPRAEPGQGPDVSQLGTVYHRILEQVCKRVPDPADLASLLAALPAVAGQVLDEAPGREGFRATAWWAQTRASIVADVAATLEALASLGGDFVPFRFEAGFWDATELTVSGAGGSFRLHGYIDRIDRSPDGALRIIDYKTGGPSTYSQKALAEGKKLQLPLYALAARDALRLGRPVEGFYWHVRHGQMSEFNLGSAEGGPEGAMDRAAAYALQAIRGVAAGAFISHRPDDGCPGFCPAAGFCWHYRSRFSG